MNDMDKIDDVKNRMLMVRGNPSLLDRDVAALYGLETKAVNQAVRNNPDKFPTGYIVQFDSEEFENWKSKILTSNLSAAEKTTIELNLVVLKITHEVTRTKKAPANSFLFCFMDAPGTTPVCHLLEIEEEAA